MIINENIKALVIGLWRQGNSNNKIALYSDLTEFQVEKIISDYQNSLKKNSMIEMPKYPIFLN